MQTAGRDVVEHAQAAATRAVAARERRVDEVDRALDRGFERRSARKSRHDRRRQRSARPVTFAGDAPLAEPAFDARREQQVDDLVAAQMPTLEQHRARAAV